MKKIGMISLGCPKNLVDSENMLGILTKDGYEITNNEEDAEILIINTCGFIESAKKESIDTILEMSDYKSDKCKLLVVTGCLAQRYKEEIMKEIPEVDVVIGTGDFQNIDKIIKRAYSGEKVIEFKSEIDLNKLDERVLSTNKNFAYLKIAEGCDNCCTYCIIPKLRGKYRSRELESIIDEAKKLINIGIKELIIVAQDITNYGSDIYGELKLTTLLREISKIEGNFFIRLMYCYPELINTELISEIKTNDKILKYIDMPVQHISDSILSKMGRRGDSRQIKEVISNLRLNIPEIVIRSSIIVGFPGETKEDFDLLLQFIKDTHFDKLGVFVYSKEEDTPAANMTNQIKKVVKNRRYNILMNAQKEISRNINNNKNGKVFNCIVDGVADDGIFYFGRTYCEAPEIDGNVYFTSLNELKIGEFVNIKILNTEEYDIIGEVVDESSK